MSKSKLDKFKETFREEARELLAGLEASLLILEDDPQNAEEISAVFRAMHTIKGSASMFGFDVVSGFTHDLETLFDRVRNGEVLVNAELVTAMLECRDHIANLLQDETDPSLPQVSRELLEKVHQSVGGSVAGEAAKSGNPGSSTLPASASKAVPVAEGIPLEEFTKEEAEGDDLGPVMISGQSQVEDDPRLATYRIRFIPEPAIFANGTRPLNLIAELSELGELTVIPYFDKIPLLNKLDPESCYVYWDLVLSTRASMAEIKDVFLFVQDSAEVEVSAIDFPEEETGEGFRIGDILLKRGVLSLDGLEQAVAKHKRMGELLVDNGVSAREIKAALEEQSHIRKVREKVQSDTSSNTIRVASEKLDSLVNLVGELVTLQARLNQIAPNMENSQLTAISEQLERLTDELRDSAMSIRMLPIGTTFTRFKRLVRDLSQDLGKEVEFRTEGGETELDKTVIDKLGEPFVHLIRNAIDHGLETPDERKKAGKNPEGLIRLRAVHVGASVQVIIEDDGRGLNAQAIREKAIERGLITPNAELDEQSIFQLITEPGFSTASQVTQLSGRGVGMDVVRREIEALGGDLIIDSRAGQGTRILLDLPLTLAIIEGLLVDTGGEHFVFPLSQVEECIEFAGKGFTGADILNHRGEVLPIISLREQLEIPDKAPARQQAVVVQSADQKTGVLVDRVIGSHQTVVKTLGRVYRPAEGISGATILGDGSIALILDVNRLCKLAITTLDRNRQEAR